MPLYDFECDRGHVTEQRAGVDERLRPCRCGLPATRLIAIPSLRVEAASIPDSEPAYQVEKGRRDLKGRGWDGDRAIEHVRTHRKEIPNWGMGFDAQKANAPVEGKRVY